MKKGSKALTINIISDTNQSPQVVGDSSGTRLHYREAHQAGDSDDGRPCQNGQDQMRLNVVQFEEFITEEDKGRDLQTGFNKSFKQIGKIASERKDQRTRKEFSIEIPQTKGSQRGQHISRTFTTDEPQQKDNFKEPPAPSHKQGNQGKSFVFPSGQMKMPQKQLAQFRKSRNGNQESEVVSEMQRAFDRERQEFYNEKCRYEKEMMVRDGQIQMLQSIITGKFVSSKEPLESSQFVYETMMLEKDLQINELLEKINELSESIEKKNAQLNSIKYDNSKLISSNESLKMQIYVYERKENSNKVTRQFYHHHHKIPLQKPSTPKHKLDQPLLSKRDQIKYNGIGDLQKRLENLSNNRVQFEDRHKIKSEIGYSQTSKNRSGNDFKGLFYKDYSRNK